MCEQPLVSTPSPLHRTEAALRHRRYSALSAWQSGELTDGLGTVGDACAGVLRQSFHALVRSGQTAKGRRADDVWAYGRIYAKRRAAEMEPEASEDRV